MKVGLDARILAHPKCGISTYVYNLVKNFLYLDSACEIFLFSDRPFHPDYQPHINSPRVHKVIFGSSKKEKKKWSQRFLPGKLKEYKIDIYHATWNNAVPFSKRCRCVLTIHDLAPWILGGHFKNKRKEIRYKLQHYFCARWADLVITDSYKGREDIIKLCRLKADKVKVVYLGLEDEFKQDLDVDTIGRVLQKHNLQNKSYLIDPVGIEHPRRNPLFVLEGFSEFLQRGSYDFYLVYTGSFHEHSKEYKNLINRIKQLQLKDRVIITGWVPTLELQVLLSQARISVIPSLYEGFGLPILESFASGAAVISTDRGSLPEVVGDAALVVNPFDYLGLAESIERLIKNENLRKSLVEKGKKRLNLFNWRDTAQATLDIYRSLLT